jgi:hypothetical protein
VLVSSPASTAPVSVIATAVPTSSGEKGGVAVAAFGGTVTGTEGTGRSQARAAMVKLRNARRGRMCLFIIYLIRIEQRETQRIFSQCL